MMAAVNKFRQATGRRMFSNIHAEIELMLERTGGRDRRSKESSKAAEFNQTFVLKLNNLLEESQISSIWLAYCRVQGDPGLLQDQAVHHGRPVGHQQDPAQLCGALQCLLR